MERDDESGGDGADPPGPAAAPAPSSRWECRCLPGYFGERCEFHRPCTAFVCQNDGTCVQTDIGDMCKCKEGFKGTVG